MADSAANPGAIHQRAHELWEQDGRPEARELDYWLMAEAELTRGAGIAGGPPVLDDSAPAAPPPGNEPGEDMTAPDVPVQRERPAR